MPRVLLPALLAAVLLVGGCGDDATPVADPGHHQTKKQRSQPVRPTASARPSRTAEPEPEPSGKVAPTLLPLTRPDGSRTHLLTVESLPALGDDVPWTIAATGPEQATPVGACQKTPLVDLGAQHAVRRAFAGPDESGVRAQQIVARFVDPKSAWRAHQVLEAWRDDCEERLTYPTKEVGPMQAVPFDTGAGGNYRATYGPKKDQDAAGLGIVRKGKWLCVVEITATSADYPTSWSPARRAVRLIGATFP